MQQPTPFTLPIDYGGVVRSAIHMLWVFIRAFPWWGWMIVAIGIALKLIAPKPAPRSRGRER